MVDSWLAQEPGVAAGIAIARHALARALYRPALLAAIAGLGALVGALGALVARPLHRAEAVLFVVEGRGADGLAVTGTPELRAAISDGALGRLELAQLAERHAIASQVAADVSARAEAVRARIEVNVDRNELGAPRGRTGASRTARVELAFTAPRHELAEAIVADLAELAARALVDRAAARAGARRAASLAVVMEAERAVEATSRASDADNVSALDEALHEANVRAERRLTEARRAYAQLLSAEASDPRRALHVETVLRRTDPLALGSVERAGVGAGVGFIVGGLVGALAIGALAGRVVRGDDLFALAGTRLTVVPRCPRAEVARAR